MKFANVAFVGLVVLGTFGSMFALQSFSSVVVMEQVKGIVVGQSCSQKYYFPIDVCVDAGTSCVESRDLNGVLIGCTGYTGKSCSVVSYQPVAQSTLESPMRSIEGWQCPNRDPVTRFPCVLKERTVGGIKQRYCGNIMTPIQYTCPSGTYNSDTAC